MISVSFAQDRDHLGGKGRIMAKEVTSPEISFLRSLPPSPRIPRLLIRAIVMQLKWAMTSSTWSLGLLAEPYPSPSLGVLTCDMRMTAPPKMFVLIK